VAGADGGPLCCLHAATFPERTRGLILCNTAPRMAWAPDYPWGQTPEEFEVDLEATKTRWGTRELAAEIVRDTTPARVNDEALVEWWAESMRLSATPSTAASLLRMHYDMDVRDVLSAIHVPTPGPCRGPNRGGIRSNGETDSWSHLHARPDSGTLCGR
jgi:pimeloyl-ACP methyl ester carboxylesterase